MKTKNKAVAPVAVFSLDDVIFSERNHAYGAYYLRKKYNDHLLLALIFVIFLFGSGISIPLILNYLFPAPIVVQPPIPIITAPDDVPYEIVPPPPPPINIPKPERNPGSSNIISVADTTPPEDSSVVIGLLPDIIPGNKLDSILGSFTGSKNPPDLNFEDPNKITFIQESATFKGGNLEKFHEWVQKNIVYPNEAAINDIKGIVYLNFAVNENGEVCDVKIQRGVYPSINDETVRVLLSSPKWTPAKQNGRNVKQHFSMPVKFILQ